MKTAFRSLLVSLASFTLLWHCERCVMEELPTQKFTDEELKMVPYAKDDTIVFLSSETNKSITYRVLDKISEYVKYSRGNPHDKYSSYCTGDYYYSQNWRISFDRDYCSIGLYIPNSFEANYYTGKTLNISFCIPDDTLSLRFYGTYKIGPDTIMTGSDTVSAYHDSLTLNGISFSDVYELLGYTIPVNQVPDFLKTAFYTKERGLVGFRTRKGVIWSLR
jgi:hypothetical protein